jgi:F-type H+-transporting ATPase subunit b|tara:strand:- start:181 stop:762 length:582 start_codon:yes stop_codon:yes gene_type:complete
MFRLFFFIVGFFFTVSQNNLLTAEVGMPQLDPTYWASQAFWLIIIFSLLYLTLSKMFIPKIKESIDDRENKIKDDLDEAQKLKLVAEEKLKEYELTIEDTKKEVQKIILESKNKLSTEIQNKKKIFEKEIEIEIKKTEQEIENLKKESLASITVISEEITSKIIEKVSGEPLNQSSIKAAVLESTKKNLGEYL